MHIFTLSLTLTSVPIGLVYDTLTTILTNHLLIYRGGLPFPKVNSNFFDLLKLKVSHAHTDTDRATATDHRGYRVFKFPHPRAPDASQVSGRERSSDAVMSSVFDDILVDAFTTDFPQNNDLKDPLTWVGIYEVTDKGLLCGNTGKDYSIETHGYVDEWIDDLCEDSFGFRLRASETLEERVSRIATFNYPVKTSSNVKCYKKLYADHAGHLYSLSLANCDITPQEPDATKKRVYVALVCSNKYNCYAGKTFSAVYDDDLKPDAALQNNLDLSVKIGYHDKDTKELILGMDARWKASFQMDVKMGIHGTFACTNVRMHVCVCMLKRMHMCMCMFT